MVQSKGSTVEDYLAELAPERRLAISAVRDAILANLPDGYEESMQFGMIGYVVPLSRYPETYNGAPLLYAALASQKRHMAVYLMDVYADPAAASWFTEAYMATGKRMDMGKSCVRFRKLDDLPVALIGEAIAGTPVEKFCARQEQLRGRGRSSNEPS